MGWASWQISYESIVLHTILGFCEYQQTLIVTYDPDHPFIHCIVWPTQNILASVVMLSHTGPPIQAISSLNMCHMYCMFCLPSIIIQTIWPILNHTLKWWQSSPAWIMLKWWNLHYNLFWYIICWLMSITLMTWKYRSGFITTMLAQSANTPSSLRNGQPGMLSSSWTMMRLWSLKQRCLASSQASQGFWEICRTQPLLSWIISS